MTSPDRAELAVALAAVVIGLYVLVGSFAIDFDGGYDRIGPRFFPYVVAGGLLLSGIMLAAGAVRRGRLPAGEVRAETSLAAIGTLILALVSSVLLLERAGFIITATLLFWLVARAFASRRPLRDGIVGLALSVFVYLAFTRGLGLVLPRGFLGGLF